MKRILLLLLFPLAAFAQAPSYPVRVDLQAPARTFTLKWAAGSSPVLAAYISDGGRAFTNLSGWTGYVYVAVTPTAGVFVSASPASSNRVDFSFASSQTATVGTFVVELVLGNGSNTYRWGTGTLSLSNSPALLGAGTVPLSGVFNWDLYSFTGTMPPQPVTYTNALGGDLTGTPEAAGIRAGVVGTNELDAEVRGLLATGSGINTNSAAWTNLVANVSAAQTAANTAGSTGTAAHVLAQAAAATGTAAHLLAAAALPTNGGTVTRITVSSNVVFGSSSSASGFETHALGRGASAGGSYSVVLGGQFGTAVGTRNVVIGGYLSEATGANDSIAAGYGAKSTNERSFVWNSGLDATYGSNGRDTFNINAPSGIYVRAVRVIDGSGNVSASTLGGYLPTDFILATSLSNYWRITTGAVTSHNATGTRGEYRRSTTNAYFHDGSQWVTWSVLTNFSH